jgi:hypothetical protein
MLATSRYRKLLEACADLVGLPPWEEFEPAEWLEGLVITESGGNPRATRYEAHQDAPGRSDEASDADAPGQNDGFKEDDTSYGLMQIMGYNIRHLCGVAGGTPMDFSFAFLPITNISLGLRILLGELSATGGHVDRALARYNGGPTGDRMVDGPRGLEMRREEYVRKVRMNADKVARDK